MRKSLFIILLVSLFLASSCGKKENTDNNTGKLKVGLVFDVGGRGDKSFNDAAYRGLEKAKQELGIEFEYIEPGPGADREAALRRLCQCLRSPLPERGSGRDSAPAARRYSPPRRR